MKPFALIAALALAACTIAPQQVEHKTASGWIKANRIGYDSTGYIVTPDWVYVYRASWKQYGTKLPLKEQPANPEDGIVLRPDGNYHVTFMANRRFDHMNEMDENSTP